MWRWQLSGSGGRCGGGRCERPVRRWRASEPEEAGDDGVQGGARAGGGRARWAAAAGMVGGGRVQTRGPI
jgi:hypothetical protein